MHILLTTTHLNPGGISRYVINLAQGLRERGHILSVASSGGDWEPELTRRGIIHIRIPIGTKGFLHPKVWLSALLLARYIRRHAITLIHANTRPTQCAALWAGAWTHTPVITTMHGFFSRTLSRRIAPLVGMRTIAVSNAVARNTIETLRFKSDAVRVVYNGIDTAYYHNIPNSKNNFSIPAESTVIGIIGRIAQEKGHFLLLDAFTQLAQSYSSLYLLIQGSGRLYEKMQDRIQATGCKNRIICTQASTRDFLGSVDILAVPSCIEGFGYAVIEGFAASKPVIAFNAGGMAELIQHGKNGILFNEYTSLSLQNALKTLIIDTNLCAQLSAAAYQSSAQYSLQHMAQNTEHIYQEIAS